MSCIKCRNYGCGNPYCGGEDFEPRYVYCKRCGKRIDTLLDIKDLCDECAEESEVSNG